MNTAVLIVIAVSALGASNLHAEFPSLENLRPKSIIAELRESPSAEFKAAGPVGIFTDLPAKGQVDEQSGRFFSEPNWDLTPGVLCTENDKDFKEYRYAERIPYCARKLSTGQKKVVSKWYGVRWEDHRAYQYDHLLSLCLGGSNDLRNIWPMPWDEARQKAKLENDLCIRLKEGKITQAAAVKEELGWFAENAPEAFKALTLTLQ